MSQSPLAIEYYFFRKSLFEVKKGFDGDFAETALDGIRPHIRVDSDIFRSEEDGSRWRVELNIKAGQKERRFPYSVNVGITGFFRVLKGYPEEKAELLVRVNGASILYAAARESIAMITGRGPYQPLLIPSLSFLPDEPPKIETALPVEKQKRPKKKTTKKT